MIGKCKCSLAISVCGEGCRYCQPQEHIDRMIADFKEIDSENDKLRDALEEIIQVDKESNSLLYVAQEAVCIAKKAIR